MAGKRFLPSISSAAMISSCDAARRPFAHTLQPSPALLRHRIAGETREWVSAGRRVRRSKQRRAQRVTHRRKARSTSTGSKSSFWMPDSRVILANCSPVIISSPCSARARANSRRVAVTQTDGQ